MSQAQSIVCPVCQKRYGWKPELADKKVRCACGQVMFVPPPAEQDDLLDLAPEPTVSAPAKPASTRDSVSDAIRTRMGIIPGKTSETREKERQLADRAAAEAKTQFSALRDVVVPIILICIGIGLLFAEAMIYTKSPLSFTHAAPIVMARIVLSVVLVGGGMFLARALLDVNIVHDLRPSLLRIFGIALGPSALYGILTFSMGDVGGSALGVILTVAVYAILFAWLLQLDTRDTAICVLMTWILIAGVNYLAFKFHGLKSDAWF